jgi:hypothetical protein
MSGYKKVDTPKWLLRICIYYGLLKDRFMLEEGE